MKTKAIASILGVCFAGSAAAQTFPSFLKKTGSYNASVFGPGGGYGAGGIEFNATGTYLYVGDVNTGNVVKVTVVRTAGKITGFASPDQRSRSRDRGRPRLSSSPIAADRRSPFETVAPRRRHVQHRYGCHGNARISSATRTSELMAPFIEE